MSPFHASDGWRHEKSLGGLSGSQGFWGGEGARYQEKYSDMVGNTQRKTWLDLMVWDSGTLLGMVAEVCSETEEAVRVHDIIYHTVGFWRLHPPSPIR